MAMLLAILLRYSNPLHVDFDSSFGKSLENRWGLRCGWEPLFHWPVLSSIITVLQQRPHQHGLRSGPASPSALKTSRRGGEQEGLTPLADRRRASAPTGSPVTDCFSGALHELGNDSPV
ncbi:hypothetical protein AAFF_G00322560 [Aldrovandia affinis]|uniref:Uncharacterized protein n=1 Tax=Aldrovandia affinis TaxID=143900 RepID=A0AAD7SMP0_9TELE|nr:hypothetical protein AAFF_G00322560 [Aldrovandia affinis]